MLNTETKVGTLKAEVQFALSFPCWTSDISVGHNLCHKTHYTMLM